MSCATHMHFELFSILCQSFASLPLWSLQGEKACLMRGHPYFSSKLEEQVAFMGLHPYLQWDHRGFLRALSNKGTIP